MRSAILASICVLPLALAGACGDDDSGDDDDVVIDAAANIDAPASTPDAGPQFDAPIAEFCTPQSGTDLQLVEVAMGLNRPVYITAPSGDMNRIFILEQPGRIRILQNGNLLPTPFLDITSAVRDTGNEQGLLGLAFHPNYGTNGRFFVNYTATSPGGDTVIAEYAVSSGDPNVADTNETRLLTIDQTESNHNGGWIGFGPDGYLYIGTGDGGNRDDDHNDLVQKGQNLGYLLAKILRIDVNTGDPYGIPADNPFVADGAALDEIWAYGLRNPWRASFDRSTGDLYIADVGQGAREEVSFQSASSTGGENYGWVHYEGTNCFDPPAGNPGCAGLTGYTMPIAEYDHLGGRCSITGGYAYRGACMTDYDGVYFYGDYCSGQVWTLEVVGGAATNEQEITSNIDPTGILDSGILTFGEDAFGEMYVGVDNGRVYRIAVE
jgi:hypothetical protein